jgi:hypothetical protein
MEKNKCTASFNYSAGPMIKKHSSVYKKQFTTPGVLLSRAD